MHLGWRILYNSLLPWTFEDVFLLIQKQQVHVWCLLCHTGPTSHNVSPVRHDARIWPFFKICSAVQRALFQSYPGCWNTSDHVVHLSRWQWAPVEHLTKKGLAQRGLETVWIATPLTRVLGLELYFNMRCFEFKNQSHFEGRKEKGTWPCHWLLLHHATDILIQHATEIAKSSKYRKVS